MSVLSETEPKEVFRYFEQICNIPHASYHEKQISDYCVKFAKEHELQVYQDSLYNIVMIKEATKGYEEEEPLILQGHLDMVCVKTPDCNIQFEKDPIPVQKAGDRIFASGTSLGGDDGIAVAYILAVLASKTLEHPRIEAVLTVSEEVGMEGAAAIDLSMLQGHRLLNLDSEEEGYFLTSCAGGLGAKVTLPVQTEIMSGFSYRISVSGLAGGHSGSEIDKGRANANLLLGRILLSLENVTEYALCKMEGGTKDNAIPREAWAEVLVAEEQVKLFEQKTAEYFNACKLEYAVTDPEMQMILEKKENVQAAVLEKESKRKVLALINLLPNGIQSMSAEIKGLVETSLNLGIISLTEKELTMQYAVRSLVQTARDYVAEKIKFLTEQMGGTYRADGVYPAWEFKKNSPFREKMIHVYQKMYGREPVIQAIHAGLECGLLAGKIENLDAVSIGPDMENVHTTEESLSISSVKRVWEYLVELLKQK